MMSARVNTHKIADTFLGGLFKAGRCFCAFTLLLASWIAAAPAHADQVVLLDSDLSSLQARFERILAPDVREINVSTFEFVTDSVGETLLALMIYRAAEGIPVRLLLDSNPYNDLLDERFLDFARSQGVQIRMFHKMELKNYLHFGETFHVLNNRMHDKLMIFNQDEVITGSRNLADAYFPVVSSAGFRAAEVPLESTERDIYVKGPSVAESHDYFMKLWNTVAPIEATPRAAKLNWVRESLAKRFKAVARNPGKGWQTTQFEIPQLRFLHDGLNERRWDRNVAYEIVGLIRKARKSIVIESPYFVLTDEMTQELQNAVRRGVEITVFTSSSEQNDSTMVQKAFESDLPQMLAEGFKIYQSRAFGHFHRKSVLVDGEEIFIGTCNMDPRSHYINLEVGFILHDAALGRVMSERSETLKQQAYLRNSLVDPFPILYPNRWDRAVDDFKSNFWKLLRPLI